MWSIIDKIWIPPKISRNIQWNVLMTYWLSLVWQNVLKLSCIAPRLVTKSASILKSNLSFSNDFRSQNYLQLLLCFLTCASCTSRIHRSSDFLSTCKISSDTGLMKNCPFAPGYTDCTGRSCRENGSPWTKSQTVINPPYFILIGGIWYRWREWWIRPLLC